jgi:hypothetical protein
MWTGVAVLVGEAFGAAIVNLYLWLKFRKEMRAIDERR